jgi:dTMP kinase
MTGERPGIFVTLDGLGGAGKTTTVAHLRRYLTESGYPVHATTEPSHAPLGEIARHQTDTYSGHALACLVAADRYHHLATDIRPNLDAGTIVICDRYVASSYVLQRMDGVPLSFIEALNADADRPNIAVILTVDPEIAAARIARRGAHTRFEAGIDNSRTEADLYRDTVERLAALGYPLLTIDTSEVQPEHVAAHIGTRIASLAGVRGLTPAAE